MLQDCFSSQQCEPCSIKIQAYTDDALHFVGGMSLFFSFTEVSKVIISQLILILIKFECSWSVHFLCENKYFCVFDWLSYIIHII